MRFSRTALAVALCFCPAIASATDRPAPAWVTRAVVVRQSWLYTEDLTKLASGGHGLPGSDHWLTPADVPSDLKNKPFESSTYLSLALDARGKPVSCAVLRASTDTRLDAIACRKLKQNAVFLPLYEGPARPVAHRINIAVDWSTVSRAAWEEQRRHDQTVPVQLMLTSVPPGRSDLYGWPRLSWHGALKVDRFPDLQSLRPAGVPGSASGTTSLELSIVAGKGAVDCTIGIGSGNAALDEAACAVASTLPLSYLNPCEICGTLNYPLQFAWLEKGSHIRVPLPWGSRSSPPESMPRDPADTRPIRARVPVRGAPFLGLSAKDFATIADKSLRNPFPAFRLAIDRDGKVTGCGVQKSTGNPAIDAHVCALFSTSRFGLMTDVFGDPVANTQIQEENLTRVS